MFFKRMFFYTFLFVSSFLTQQGRTEENEDFIRGKEINDIVKYAFSVQVYNQFYILVTDKLESDPSSAGYKVYPKLGKVTTAGIWKTDTGYVVKLNEDLPYELKVFNIAYDASRKCYYINRSASKGKQIHVGNIEFEIPQNFIEIASAFGPNSGKEISQLKESLTRMVGRKKDVSKGTHHFYVKPFNDYTGMEDMHIYWVEQKTILRFRPGPRKDLSELDYPMDFWKFLDLASQELPMAPIEGMERTNHIILSRYNYSNAWVANCVRDGKLIIVEKE